MYRYILTRLAESRKHRLNELTNPTTYPQDTHNVTLTQDEYKINSRTLPNKVATGEDATEQIKSLDPRKTKPSNEPTELTDLDLRLFMHKVLSAVGLNDRQGYIKLLDRSTKYRKTILLTIFLDNAAPESISIPIDLQKVTNLSRLEYYHLSDTIEKAKIAIKRNQKEPEDELDDYYKQLGRD